MRPLFLAGDPLLDCVPARLSPVASMAPGDVCHGPRCSLAGLGPVALEYRSCHWPGGSAGSPQCVRPMGYWFFPVPRPPYVCAVSWAAWLLFTGVPARFAVLRLRCPGPLGSCSPVCWLGVLCCVCCVLGHLAPVHRCAGSVCCVACAVSWAPWLLFIGVPARFAVLRLRCPGPLGSCSPVCSLGVLCCVCGVLGHLAPVHRCARCVRCACAMGGCVHLPPPLIFVFFCVFFLFFLLEEKEKQGRAYTAGTDTGSWCGGATVLCLLACVVGPVATVAPQGCGSRVLMYTGLGQGGFDEVSLCFWSPLVRRLCGLWVWAVVTLFPRRAWLGVKG